jgi:hypothetical protein
MAIERVPFAIAIADKNLLKPRWDQLSQPQRVVLKAFYGLPLNEEELIHWSIFQGGASYDKLGFVTSVTPIPYKPKEYDTLVLYVGRRSGKTDKIISTGVAYEITLGGHGKYLQFGQTMKVPFIAQTSGDAQQNMNFIRLALEESPLLSRQLPPESEQVASEIRLGKKNASGNYSLIVEPLPANKSVGRGHAIPVWVGDETAFWYTDSSAANPDFEVQRAINYAQLQFPNAKQFIGTTPWAEQGIAFEEYKAGTEGRKLKCDDCKVAKAELCTHPLEDRDEHEGVLVIHASTAAMGNPLITRKKLIQIEKRDPDAFPRESLAQTLKSVSGWLSPDKVDASIDAGIQERKRLPRVEYVAAMDPAFRKDSFAFTIVHHDRQKGIVQDYVEYWTPSKAEALKPGTILDSIKAKLDEYGLGSVYSDQYQLESLQQLALDRNFVINGYDFTGKSKGQITGSFKVLVNQARLRLLDNEAVIDQLKQLQRRVLQSGNVQIAAPPGKHDDLAMVLILAARIVLWMLASDSQEDDPDRVLDPDKDHHKMVLEQIQRRKDEAQADAEFG